MKRRDFLKFFGLGLVASVATRTAEARVCIRDVETETGGPVINLHARVVIVEQLIRKQGRIVSGGIQFRHTGTGTIATNIRLFTFPAGFRPSATQLFPYLAPADNPASIVRIEASGNVYYHDRDRGPNSVAFIPFTFIQ